MLAFDAMKKGVLTDSEEISENEAVVDFTNGALTEFLIKLSSNVEQSDEHVIGSYFHVLNDLERIGDHAENFFDIAAEMSKKKIDFSERALKDLGAMHDKVVEMIAISREVFDNLNKDRLTELAVLEEQTDRMKRELTASHFARLADGDCSMEVSPYYSSVIVGLERIADHLVNVGYSIVNPIGSQKE